MSEPVQDAWRWRWRTSYRPLRFMEWTFPRTLWRSPARMPQGYNLKGCDSSDVMSASRCCPNPPLPPNPPVIPSEDFSPSREPALSLSKWTCFPAFAIFDFVVSNPPYVAFSEADKVQRSVFEFEPRMAVFAGENGLDVIRPLIEQAHDALKPGGWLALEIGYSMRDAVVNLLSPRRGMTSASFRTCKGFRGSWWRENVADSLRLVAEMPDSR